MAWWVQPGFFFFFHSDLIFLITQHASSVLLDLSYNNIEKIEGLDTLVKLQDLILFNNRISVIENMDALLNIEIISLGNNLISQLDSVSPKALNSPNYTFIILLYNWTNYIAQEMKNSFQYLLSILYWL